VALVRAGSASGAGVPSGEEVGVGALGEADGIAGERGRDVAKAVVGATTSRGGPRASNRVRVCDGEDGEHAACSDSDRAANARGDSGLEAGNGSEGVVESVYDAPGAPVGATAAASGVLHVGEESEGGSGGACGGETKKGARIRAAAATAAETGWRVGELAAATAAAWRGARGQAEVGDAAGDGGVVMAEEAMVGLLVALRGNGGAEEEGPVVVAAAWKVAVAAGSGLRM